MKHTTSKSTLGDVILNSPIATVIFSLIAIALGILFIFITTSNTPASREEALSYSGEFAKYESGRSYCSVEFKDGSSYDVYPHTVSAEFERTMESLKEGTKLYILVNPNNDYVAEIRTDNAEILNFEKSQQEIDSYDNGYIVIGIIVIVCGVFLLSFGTGLGLYKKKETEKHAERNRRHIDGKSDAALHRADTSVKSRTLLEAVHNEYTILYRRLNHTNELVINGYVYDRKKGVIEFEHKLVAELDGHLFEAGFDGNSSSYIRVDKKTVAKKKRII